MSLRHTVGIFLSAVFLVFPCLPQCSAQAAKAQADGTPLTLRLESNLVLVDVVVTDQNRPVHGLARNQFRIFENGIEQSIASFDEHRASSASVTQPRRELPPSTWTNLPEHPESPAVNVILLDGLNTLSANQMDVRRQMLHFLGQLPVGTQIAIFTLGTRLRQLTGFTTDGDVLTAALKTNEPGQHAAALRDPEADAVENEWMAQIASNFTPAQVVAMMRQFQAEQAAFNTDRRVEMTLEALGHLARYLSGIPGRKNLIWFSGSFPVALDPDSTLENPFPSVRNYAAQIRETSDLLSAARVAVYPVDARGLMHLPSLDASNSSDANQERGAGTGMRPTSSVPTFSMADAKFDQSVMAEHTTMQQVAVATGGREFINTNDFGKAVAEAIDDGSSYYTIAYVPSAKQFDGSFRKLAVRTDDARLHLAFRRGYYADPPGRPSEHGVKQANALALAAVHGAPPTTQVVFEARVLLSDDLLLQDAKMPEGPAGMNKLKGPVRRYVADVRVDGRLIAFSQAPDGVQHAQIEFVLLAFDAAGKRTNYLDKLYYVDMKPEMYSQAMRDGITARLALDVPPGPASLRMVVYDPGADHAGSLEIPLASPK